jgi:hypothetical protein
MKRLILVLAAALLGTGCLWGDDECDRSVTVDWSGFVLAEGGPPAGCAAAGVGVVDVWLNGQFWGSFDCFGPPASVGLARGQNVLTVEGIDAQNRIAYREEVAVDSTSCGHRGTVATQPAEGFLELDYSFSPANACFAPQPTFIWLAVFDEVAGDHAFVETGETAFQQCTVTDPAPLYRLPVGVFTLLGVEEVLPGGATVGSDCTDRAFEVGAALTTPVTPALVDSALQCF